MLHNNESQRTELIIKINIHKSVRIIHYTPPGRHAEYRKEAVENISVWKWAENIIGGLGLPFYIPSNFLCTQNTPRFVCKYQGSIIINYFWHYRVPHSQSPSSRSLGTFSQSSLSAPSLNLNNTACANSRHRWRGLHINNKRLWAVS